MGDDKEWYYMTENKRHIHYINPAIQNRLIISFIVFEVVLVTLTLYVFYMDINGIVEDNLYRIHVSETTNIELFLAHLFKVVCVLLIVNIFIASIVVWWWHHYINSIVEPLERLIKAITKLDLSQDIDVSHKHDVLINMNKWYVKEKETYQSIRKLVAEIRPGADVEIYKQNYEALNKIKSFL